MMEIDNDKLLSILGIFLIKIIIFEYFLCVSYWANYLRLWWKSDRVFLFF